MHLHSLQYLQRVGIEVVEIVISITRSFTGEEESVITDFGVQGFVD